MIDVPMTRPVITVPDTWQGDDCDVFGRLADASSFVIARASLADESAWNDVTAAGPVPLHTLRRARNFALLVEGRIALYRLRHLGDVQRARDAIAEYVAENGWPNSLRQLAMQIAINLDTVAAALDWFPDAPAHYRRRGRKRNAAGTGDGSDSACVE